MNLLKIAQALVGAKPETPLSGLVTLVVEFPYGGSDSAHQALQAVLTAAAPQLAKAGVKVKEIHTDKLRDAEMDRDDGF